MKVLLVASPAFYNNRNGIGSPYNGGGWMYTIQKLLIDNPDIELGVCFRACNTPVVDVQKGVHYYGYSNHTKSLKNKIIDLIKSNDETRDALQWEHYLSQARMFIDDFKPDIIHIFGSETYNQLIAIAAKEKNIPTLLHIQGILSLYIYSILPPGVSKWNYIMKDGLKCSFSNFQELISWRRDVYREKQILSSVTYVAGRTDWDKNAAALLAPQAKYFYCGEILRPEFYDSYDRILPSKLTIISISSNALYKGFDIILKTADILKNQMHIDFEWNVYGNINPSFWEKHLRLNHRKLNINLCGVADAKTLCYALSKSTLYFQSSYIENSPNSLAEAQILGVPVVATNVGGTSSMIEYGQTGFLFPPTDPYTAVVNILNLYNSRTLNREIGNKSINIAKKRHSLHAIESQTIDLYNDIVENC